MIILQTKNKSSSDTRNMALGYPQLYHITILTKTIGNLFPPDSTKYSLVKLIMIFFFWVFVSFIFGGVGWVEMGMFKKLIANYNLNLTNP